MSAAPDPHEIEAALFVCAPDPAAFADQVAALRELAGYRLEPGADERIRDVYFDTPSHALRAREIGLRLRRKDDRFLLTLKADAERGNWGVRRFEREVPWSSGGLATLDGDLSALGVAAALQPAWSPRADPIRAISRSGLVAIQNRETHRRVRQIRGDGTNQALAELSIDACVFHLPGGDVRCFEVEIEKKDGEAAVVERLRDALCDRFPRELRPWSYSKLETGFALERLLTERGRTTIVDSRGMFKSEFCRDLHEVLAAARPDD